MICWNKTVLIETGVASFADAQKLLFAMASLIIFENCKDAFWSRYLCAKQSLNLE